jgi:signal peptidase II
MNLKRVLQVPIFILDYYSKMYVTSFFEPPLYSSPVFPFGGISIFRNFLGIDFCIHHVTNRGAAWGLFSTFQEALLLFRISVIIGLIIYMVRSPKAKPFYFPLTLIITGALGNVVDYFLYGHVVDMFHFIFWGRHYPVFNIADSAIFCGIVWICLHSYFSKREKCSTLPNG